MSAQKEEEKPAVFIFTTAYHPFVGGVEVAIKEITERLRGRFKFFIVTARMRRDLARCELRPEGVVIRIGFGSPIDKWFFPFIGAMAAAREIKRIGPLPILLWGVDISVGALAAYLVKWWFPRIPFVFSIQYGYGEERLRHGRFGMIRRAFGLMLRRADAVTAISRYLADLAKQFGYKEQVAVLPNGVAVERFLAVKSGPHNAVAPVIITVSRLVYKNGIDILVRAIAEVKKSVPKVRCHIIGDGPERTTLENLALALGIENEITFFGSVPYEEVPEYLNAASVFVRPSRSEGMGNAFVEALAAGLPIIGTPVGGIPDIIRDGETGLFCRVDDPADLAEKILRLLTDRTLANRIVANGRRVVMERFSWKEIADDFGNIFQRLIHKTQHHRILIATGIFPPDIGGPATYSKLLAGELPRKGFGVEVLSFGSVRHLPKGIRHLAYFWMVLRMSCNADTIFAQDPVSVGLPSAIAAKLLNKKFVLKVVGDYAWEQGMQRFGVSDPLDDFLNKRYGFRVEILRKAQKASAGAASMIIVPSNYLKGVVAKWGIAEDKIRVIYNAFEAENAPLRSREETRRELGLSGSVAISVGRLVPWKGLLTLIGIVPEIIKDIPDFKLVIVGSGPEEEHLKSKANSLRNSVLFIGRIPHDELLKYFRAADLFVLNTGYEGFSHTILEAMAAGIPVITTSVGGNTEIVINGVNGILVPYDNREELKRAIVGLCKNEELKRALISNAKSTLDKFSKVKMIEDTITLLSNL